MMTPTELQEGITTVVLAALAHAPDHRPLMTDTIVQADVHDKMMTKSHGIEVLVVIVTVGESEPQVLLKSHPPHNLQRMNVIVGLSSCSSLPLG